MRDPGSGRDPRPRSRPVRCPSRIGDRVCRRCRMAVHDGIPGSPGSRFKVSVSDCGLSRGRADRWPSSRRGGGIEPPESGPRAARHGIWTVPRARMRPYPPVGERNHPFSGDPCRWTAPRLHYRRGDIVPIIAFPNLIRCHATGYAPAKWTVVICGIVRLIVVRPAPAGPRSPGYPGTLARAPSQPGRPHRVRPVRDPLRSGRRRVPAARPPHRPDLPSARAGRMRHGFARRHWSRRPLRGRIG